VSRTPLFDRLRQTLRAASGAPDRLGRRDLLRGGAALAGSRIVGGCVDEPAETVGVERAPLRAATADVGIVGAGIAGLACAYELRRSGIVATIHEASDRVGGRMFSMGGAFPSSVDWRGQVIERGGELIDTAHKTMIGYARELGLALEEVTKPARETFYWFGGERVSEPTLVDEYRDLVDAMRDDLRVVGAPTADAYTPMDQALDRLSLAEWLERRGAAPRIKALLSVAYEIEYGVSAAEQSALAFLLFAKASRQSKLRLFGNFSDERYHVLGGNQQIPQGLAARMGGQLRFGRRLVAARKRSDGRVELTFKEGNRTVTATHDAVVLTLPFPLLRGVALDPSLDLPPWKRDVIARSVYGANSKLMVGFAGRPWIALGGSGATYSDLPTLQATWETNPALADDRRAVITSYTGGALARSLDPARAATERDRFLAAFETIVPGAKARARAGVFHLESWDRNPLAGGGYTANPPGYFTTSEGREARPVGNLYFAGETTDSFYSWQGFMEGGALSGLRAAREITR